MVQLLAPIDETLPLGGIFNTMQLAHLHLVIRTAGVEVF
jgi:hypothetical protein